MEALWRDLSKRESEIVSPEWHRETLAEREQSIASGAESFTDWEIAKKLHRFRH